MMQFQGFKPEAMNRIAKALGHEGDMGGFQDFLEKNPEKKEMMEGFNKKAIKMMQGGYVKGYANGGVAEYTGPQPRDRGYAPQMIEANFNSQLPNISTGMFAGQQPTALYLQETEHLMTRQPLNQPQKEQQVF